MRVCEPRKLCDATVDGSERSVERNGAGRVIERIDELLEVALRAHDDLAELIQLLFGRRRTNMLLQSPEQSLEFVNFAPPTICISGEQDRERQDADGNGAQLKGHALQSLPEESHQGDRQKDHEQEHPSPKLRLFPIKISWRIGT